MTNTHPKVPCASEIPEQADGWTRLIPGGPTTDPRIRGRVQPAAPGRLPCSCPRACSETPPRLCLLHPSSTANLRTRSWHAMKSNACLESAWNGSALHPSQGRCVPCHLAGQQQSFLLQLPAEHRGNTSPRGAVWGSSGAGSFDGTSSNSGHD